MAEYTFKRGKFGRWGVPMWAGETQAFKLIRLLRKQGIKGILYEEGPLVPYLYEDHTKYRRCAYADLSIRDPYIDKPKPKIESTAPKYFKVIF
jgi:hypothetical protein